jgi:hypothetical protein
MARATGLKFGPITSDFGEMADLAGMPSYFWMTSSRLKEPIQDDVPYTTQALRQDLRRLRIAWEECQASRDRNAIYGYLSGVFDLVMWWAAEDRAVSRARWALRLCRLDLPNDEPFAAIILCASYPGRVDKRTRSKWSRVLRYAAEYKPVAEPLASFVQRRGGINKCAARFTRGRGGCRQLRRRSVPGVNTADAAAQCWFARMIASERAPTRMRLTAQVASRLNQLRDTNLRPR